MTENSYLALGMMSGTSLDGLDLCLARMEKQPKKWTYKIKAASTLPYPAEWQGKLKFHPSLSGHALLQLDHHYGKWLGQQVLLFLRKKKHTPK
ncbi:MAG: anhydro-N-acetylmuramic acid kinase [Owenweeksia sp.]|nr:anhydro-N-acetylmuramic acid kinase [Owenweeksia sp.]